MKHAPPKEFENAEPLTDFRYFLSENQPLHVRFFKAVIDSKIIFRTLMGTGLTVAGVAAADVAWGGHDLTQVLSCNVSYIDTEYVQCSISIASTRPREYFLQGLTIRIQC